MKLRIREIRKQRGLTQVQVAEMAGMSQSYFTDLENGKKTINAIRMSQIAKVLGVQPQDLIESPMEYDLNKLILQLDPDEQELVKGLILKLAAAKPTS